MAEASKKKTKKHKGTIDENEKDLELMRQQTQEAIMSYNENSETTLFEERVDDLVPDLKLKGLQHVHPSKLIIKRMEEISQVWGGKYLPDTTLRLSCSLRRLLKRIYQVYMDFIQEHKDKISLK